MRAASVAEDSRPSGPEKVRAAVGFEVWQESGSIASISLDAHLRNRCLSAGFQPVGKRKTPNDPLSVRSSRARVR